MDTQNDGLENVFPFKYMAISGIYFKFQAGIINHSQQVSQGP